MDGNKGKTSRLAEALGVSVQEAQEFGNLVNHLLQMQTCNAVSFALIAKTVSMLAEADRTAPNVAQHLLPNAPHLETDFAMKKPSARLVVSSPKVEHVVQPISRTVVRHRIDWGEVVYVHEYYVTVVLPSGESVNCQIRDWQSRGIWPIIGMKVQIHYALPSGEVLLILAVKMPVESSSPVQAKPIREQGRNRQQIPTSPGPAKTPRQEHQNEMQTPQDQGQWKQSEQGEAQKKQPSRNVGFDQVYYEERQKEGHRYEIISFIGEEREHIEWYQMVQAKNPRYLALPSL